MKLRLSDICLPAILIVVAATIILLTGCARTPAGIGLSPVRSVTVELNFNGPINDDLYYYMVIDADGSGTGPLPVFPGNTPGQGWVTGSATHFVEYHRGQFTVYKFLDFDQFQYVQIGTPIRFSAQGQTLSFTIDLNDLGITGNSVDVNFITLDSPFDQHRIIDSLIDGGASTLNLDITRDNTINNAQLGFIEQPDDLRNENAAPTPATEITRSLDLTDWSIAIDL